MYFNNVIFKGKLYPMYFLLFLASAKGKQSTKASGTKKSKSSKTAKKVSGLKRNLVPEKIVGAKKFEKGIVYLVKWLVICFFFLNILFLEFNCEKYKAANASIIIFE